MALELMLPSQLTSTCDVPCHPGPVSAHCGLHCSSIKRADERGIWGGSFGEASHSGLGLRSGSQGREIEPHIGLHTFSLSLCPFLPTRLSYSLSKKKGRKEGEREREEGRKGGEEVRT